MTLYERKIGRDATTDPARQGEYFAFGLLIRSDIPLPELSPSEPTGHASDLTIRLAWCGRPLPSRDGGVVIEIDPAGRHYLAWPGVAAFRFDGISQIDVEPYPDVPMSFLAFPLLGPVFGLLLHLRGLFLLHASAVEIGGRGVAFVGDKLAGKSTTAGAFIRSGHRLLTDDLLAVNLADPATPRILPAFAQLKLSDDSSTAVQLNDAEALPLAYEGFAKRQYRLTSPFSHKQVPLDYVFVLARGGASPAIEALQGFDALSAVLRFSYATRFGSAVLSGRAEGEQLQSCGRLLRRIGVYRLTIPGNLDRIDETVERVVALVGKR